MLVSDAVIWDSETTGTDTLLDEIISIAAVRVDGTVLLNERIRPLHLGRNAESGAQAVNGITPDALRCAPPIEAVYPAIRDALQDKPWVIYNAAFDTPILERDCLRHGLPPLVSSGVTCAMTWYARFNEEWDLASVLPVEEAGRCRHGAGRDGGRCPRRARRYADDAGRHSGARSQRAVLGGHLGGNTFRATGDLVIGLDAPGAALMCFASRLQLTRLQRGSDVAGRQPLGF